MSHIIHNHREPRIKCPFCDKKFKVCTVFYCSRGYKDNIECYLALFDVRYNSCRE